MKPGAVCVLLALALLSASSLACSSTALPSLFATPTFTPTLTPSITPSPLPTATPTLRPTATPKPTGTHILDQLDGSRLFLDYDGGYQVEFPAYWTPLPLTKADIEQAISQFGDLNPQLEQQFELVKSLDPDVFRLFAFSKEVSPAGYMTNINVARVESSLAASLPLDMLIQANMESMKSQFPDAIITTGESRVNKNGIEIAAIEIDNFKMNLPNGVSLKLYEKQLYFTMNKALVIITLATAADDSQRVLPYFDQLFDTIASIEAD